MNAIAYCLSISIFIFSPGVGSGRRLGRYIYVILYIPYPYPSRAPRPGPLREFSFSQSAGKKEKKTKKACHLGLVPTRMHALPALPRVHVASVLHRASIHTRACTRTPTHTHAPTCPGTCAPRHTPPGEGADSRPAKPPAAIPPIKPSTRAQERSCVCELARVLSRSLSRKEIIRWTYYILSVANMSEGHAKNRHLFPAHSKQM